MGAEAARQYNYNQAKRVVDGLGRIINRINKKYYPDWIKRELDDAYHQAQCILQERERIMRGYGDKFN